MQALRGAWSRVCTPAGVSERTTTSKVHRVPGYVESFCDLQDRARIAAVLRCHSRIRRCCRPDVRGPSLRAGSFLLVYRQEILSQRQFVGSGLAFTLNDHRFILDVDDSYFERVGAGFDLADFTFCERAVIDKGDPSIRAAGNTSQDHHLGRFWRLRQRPARHLAIWKKGIFPATVIKG